MMRKKKDWLLDCLVDWTIDRKGKKKRWKNGKLEKWNDGMKERWKNGKKEGCFDLSVYRLTAQHDKKRMNKKK